MNLKKIYIFLIISLLASSVKAQFGNEWIQYDQTYYRIPVVQKGIYRLSFQDLKAAGLIQNINPQTFQLFRRGQEIAIRVGGESDKIWNETDFIEFYGESNDGTLDSALYSPNKAQAHQYFSLFSDTAVFWLTYNAKNILGKRMQEIPKVDLQNLPKLTYHIEEILQLTNSNFAEGMLRPLGTTDPESVLMSFYDFGEGYFSPKYSKNNNPTHNFTLTNWKRESSAKPRIEIMSVGTSPYLHTMDVFLKNTKGQNQLIGTAEWNNYESKTLDTSVVAVDIPSNNLLTISANLREYKLNRGDYALAYLKVRFPQSLDMAGLRQKQFNFETEKAQSYAVEIQNASTDANVWDISNPREVKKIFSEKSGNTLIFSITSKQKTDVQISPFGLLISSDYLSIKNIQASTFRQIPTKANYLIVSHPKLMSPAGGYANPVRAYASYRASVPGGKYDTTVVTFSELTNIFNYGEYSPLAIKKFVNYMIKKGSPKFMFIIGQAITDESQRFLPTFNQNNLIPTAGYPHSDMPYVMNFDGKNDFLPIIPTGRLNTNSSQTVADYLKKVQEHDSPENQQLFRKNLLFLTGGYTNGEQVLFRNYGQYFKSIAENSLVGAKGTVFTKRTDDGIEIINIAEQLNAGLGMITSFGHSGFNVIDLDIGNINNEILGYKNKGKYPFLWVNGCEAGNCFNGEANLGSNWIAAPDRGAIAFMGHTWWGYPFALRSFAEVFYKKAFTDSLVFSQPLGSVHQATVRQYLQNSRSEYDFSNAVHFNLQGDPAIRLFPAQKPDFTIGNSDIFLSSLDGKLAFINDDSLRLGLVISNLGKFFQGNLNLTLKRKLSKGDTELYRLSLSKSLSYQDTLFVKIANDLRTSGGNNRFEVALDNENQVAEINETNNVGVWEYNAPNPSIELTFPANYAIVNNRAVKLSISLPQVIQNQNVILEIDTLPSFDSKLKIIQNFTAKSLVTLAINLPERDSTVYFWRILPQKPIVGLSQSATKSFTFIKNGQEGWSQSGKYQLDDTQKENLDFKNENWSLKTSKTKISVRVQGTSVPFDAKSSPMLTINDQVFVPADKVCDQYALMAVAFDKQSLEPYSYRTSWDLRCRNLDPRVSMINIYFIVNFDMLKSYVEEIKDGDYILFFSFNNPQGAYAAASKQALQGMKDLGVDMDKLAQLPYGSPYIFLGQKGNNKAIYEAFPTANQPQNQILSFEKELNSSFISGLITSPKIGPAKSWNEVISKTIRVPRVIDSLWVYGFNEKGEREFLLGNYRTDKMDLSKIEAKKYPYLQLETTRLVEAGTRVNQLKKWQISYENLPEAVADISASDKISAKDEGENFTTKVVFRNVSNRAFGDSLTIRQVRSNRELKRQEFKTFKVQKLLSGDSVQVSVPFKTMGWAGENQLSFTINPQILPELSYQNNFIDYNFSVKPDQANPILEVTFDGKKIRNNEIVSPTPLIGIRLKDENRFLLRNDPEGIDVFLKKCKKCNFQKINFSNPEITWKSLSDNDFRIEYRPTDLPEDTLTLQVQGRDMAGNLAGNQPYQITFRIVKNPSVKTFTVYPNPLRLYTKFLIELSGKEAADICKIQIFNTLGQQLQELSTEKQNLPIGTTELIWDGTDSNKQALPSGVYIYKLLIEKNGQSVVLDPKTINQLSGKIVIDR
jgi:Peptidase family C25